MLSLPCALALREQRTNEMTTALIVIDVQRGMFGERRPHRGEEVLGRIAGLLASARVARVPVIHIQHCGPPGHPLEPGTPGWEHHPAVAPIAGETVVQKHTSSAFHGTGLQQRLQAIGADRLVMAGMQTEMCVESTCRAAVALDYRVVLADDAHTTYDTEVLPAAQIVAHHNRTWGRAFATLAHAADVDWNAA
jgi:nicotinamidase-related amidase